jgi:multiple sugar transport system substrate-binding protein
MGVAVFVALVLAPVVYRLSQGFSHWRPAGGIYLKYMAWGNPQQLNVEREIIRLFNEKCWREGTNVRMELFMPPAGGYAQKLRLMLASGTGPDVVRVDHYDFPALVPKGYFRDLSDLAGADPTFDAADFHPAAMRENYYNGRLYGLNVLFGGAICYYNQDLFAQALLPDPYELWKEGKWTWEAFEEAAEKLTIRKGGKTIQYGFMLPGWGGGGTPPYAWFIWVWGEGGEILSPDGRSCVLDTPQAIRAFQRMRDLRYKLKVCPTPADAAAAAFSFESGNIAMDFNFAGMAPRYRDNVRDFRWDVVPTPSPPGAPYSLVKGNQLVMSATCKHPKEAWEWMKFMVSPEVELMLHGDKLRRSIPTRKSLLHPPPGTPNERNYLYAARPFFHTDIFPFVLDHAKELPIDAAWPVWTTEAQKHLDNLFVDEEASAEKVLPAAKLAIDRVLAQEHKRLERYLNRGEAADAN